MENNNLILVEQFCTNCDIEFSFIDSLNEFGLIDLIVLNEQKYISHEQLRDIEKMIGFHYELKINMEGIDVISNLLKQITELQQELAKAKNKLNLLDPK